MTKDFIRFAEESKIFYTHTVYCVIWTKCNGITKAEFASHAFSFSVTMHYKLPYLEECSPDAERTSDRFQSNCATGDRKIWSCDTSLQCAVAVHFYRAALYASVVFVIVMPSVRLSVRPSHACIVRKRTKVPPTFLYHIKGKFIYFSDRKNGWWGMPPCTWHFASNWPTHPASKTAISTRYLLVAAQPLELAKKFNYD